MRAAWPWACGLLWLSASPSFADTPTTPVAHHALWEVRGPQGTLLLAGSVHLLKSDGTGLPAALLDAYAHTDELWMELDLLQSVGDALSPEIQQLEMLPPDTTLAATLGPALYQQWVERTRPLGMEPALMTHFQPWYAAMQLETFTLLHDGYDAESGVDMTFARKAQEDHKKVLGLETLAQQLSIFAHLSLTEQREFLRRTLEDSDDSDPQLKVMIQAWEQGDSATLSQEADDFAKESPKLYQSLLVQRNRRWMDQLLPLLRSDRHALVIVGTLHLVGPDGLVALFRRAGYTVVQD